MPKIIADPADVSAEWLSEVLQLAGFTGTVATFTRTKVGTGQVGLNVRFGLTYKSGEGPASIVGKFASDNPTSRQTGIEQNTYLKEVRFYQQLRPTVSISTPDVLFTDINQATHEFCLMMEDLAPAEPGNQIRGCNKNEATLAVTELVQLHGPRWADPLLEDLPWLYAGHDEQAAEIGATVYAQIFPAFVDRYRSRLTREHIVVGEKLGHGFKNWSLGYQGPRTLIHRDYRLDNILFGGKRGLTVVDWQTPSLGAGVSDLAYFIGAGLKPELRRACEHDLVTTYHQGLRDFGIADYDFAECWNDYRRYSFSGYFMAVFASMVVGQTNRGDEMFMAMASRHAQQVIDLHADDFL